MVMNVYELGIGFPENYGYEVNKRKTHIDL